MYVCLHMCRFPSSSVGLWPSTSRKGYVACCMRHVRESSSLWDMQSECVICSTQQYDSLRVSPWLVSGVHIDWNYEHWTWICVIHGISLCLLLSISFIGSHILAFSLFSALLSLVSLSLLSLSLSLSVCVCVCMWVCVCVCWWVVCSDDAGYGSRWSFASVCGWPCLRGLESRAKRRGTVRAEFPPDARSRRSTRDTVPRAGVVCDELVGRCLIFIMSFITRFPVCLIEVKCWDSCGDSTEAWQYVIVTGVCVYREWTQRPPPCGTLFERLYFLLFVSGQLPYLWRHCLMLTWSLCVGWFCGWPAKARA
jgi:hypothetical protein